MIGTRGASASFIRSDRGPLHPFLGVLQRMQIGGAGMGQALHADKEPRFIHHVKHDAHAGIFPPQQIADAGAVLAKVETAGRAPVNAHFVLDPGAGDVIVDEAAIFIVAQPRHDKDGNAPDAFGRPVDSGQHHVDDVFASDRAFPTR